MHGGKFVVVAHGKVFHNGLVYSLVIDGKATVQVNDTFTAFDWDLSPTQCVIRDPVFVQKSYTTEKDLRMNSGDWYINYKWFMDNIYPFTNLKIGADVITAFASVTGVALTDIMGFLMTDPSSVFLLTDQEIRMFCDIAGASFDANRIALLRQIAASGYLYVPHSVEQVLHKANFGGLKKVEYWNSFLVFSKFKSDNVSIKRWIAQSATRITSAPRIDLRECFPRFEMPELTDEQKMAVRLVTSGQSGIKIITGGPGTGKSLLISVISRILCAMRGVTEENVANRPPVEILTLSNETRDHLRKVTGLPLCLSIAAAKHYNPSIQYTIVDEASMVGTKELSTLLRLRPNLEILLLIGDADQLPPVTFGFPFHSLVRNGHAVTRLSKCMRSTLVIPDDAVFVPLAEAVRMECVILCPYREDVRTVSSMTRNQVMTVNSAQGGEWPVVVLYTSRIGPFISRELVYTGLTRAKTRLYISGEFTLEVCRSILSRRSSVPTDPVFCEVSLSDLVETPCYLSIE